MDMKKTVTALSVAAFAAATTAMPVAASNFVAGGEFQVADHHAKKGCNPCAAKKGCNPCAAKKR